MSDPTIRPRTADRIATIIILILGVVGSSLGTLLAFTFIFVGDSCGVSGLAACRSDLLGLGILVSAVAPWLLLVAFGAVAIIRLVRKRYAWWWAAIAVLGGCVAWFGGGALALASNPNFTV